MEALAWEQEPPKTQTVSRSFFDRGVGSSILASLSEAGGNDQHLSVSKPLPSRPKTCVSRPSECVHVFLHVHAVGQNSFSRNFTEFLIFLCFPVMPLKKFLFAGTANPDSGVGSPTSGIVSFLKPSLDSFVNHAPY